MKRLLSALAIGFIVVGGMPASAQDDRVNAVVTIGMIADVIGNVGGSCVDVTAIMGPGVDPHLYEASASDVRRFQYADVIFYSGYSLEGQLGAVLERFGEQKPAIAVAPSSIDPSNLITVQDIYGIDPHLWMDVSLWSRIAPTIAGTLGELKPDCADQFDANAAAYGTQLSALHDWVGDAVASIPEQHRALVTAHDAFQYFGRAYGLTFLSPQGLSTEAEVSAQDVARLIERIRDEDISAVFVENITDSRLLEQIANETGATIGGTLYPGALSEEDGPAPTYLDMMRHNATTLAQALSS